MDYSTIFNIISFDELLKYIKLYSIYYGDPSLRDEYIEHIEFTERLYNFLQLFLDKSLVDSITIDKSQAEDYKNLYGLGLEYGAQLPTGDARLRKQLILEILDTPWSFYLHKAIFKNEPLENIPVLVAELALEEGLNDLVQ